MWDVSVHNMKLIIHTTFGTVLVLALALLTDAVRRLI